MSNDRIRVKRRRFLTKINDRQLLYRWTRSRNSLNTVDQINDKSYTKHVFFFQRLQLKRDEYYNNFLPFTSNNMNCQFGKNIQF